MTCGTVEENLRNNRALKGALAGQGYDVALVENRDGHNWVAGATRSTRTCATCCCGCGREARRRRDLVAVDRRRGQRRGVRPLGPAAAGLPVAAGQPLGLRGERDGGRARVADRGRAGEDLRVDWFDARELARRRLPLEARAAARRYEDWIVTRWCRGSATTATVPGDRGHGRSSVPTTRPTSPPARRPVPARDLPERCLRRLGRRLGRTRRRRLLQQPDGLRRPGCGGDHLDWLRAG